MIECMVKVDCSSKQEQSSKVNLQMDFVTQSANCCTRLAIFTTANTRHLVRRATARSSTQMVAFMRVAGNQTEKLSADACSIT